jgi:fatty-acyl-CoA synthase
MSDAPANATTVADLIVARRDDEHVGLRFEDASWAWADVVRECAVRAAVLQGLRGDGPFHVGVLLENVPEYVFLLGGAALAGATVVGINATRRGDELARDIRHTRCQFVVTEAALAPLLDGLDLGCPVFVYETGAWSALLDRHATAAPPAELPSPDALFVLMFTSGSTGAPKAVRGSQGRFARFGAAMPFTADDVLYCAMPLFHGNALSAAFIPAFTSGATLVLRRRFSASEFLTDLRRYGATYFNTVGRALSYVLATPPSEHDRDHNVKFGLGPESSASDLKAFRARFGVPIVTGYSQSEGAITLQPARGAYAGALGVIADGADVVVVDPASAVECERARFDEHGRLLNADAAIGEIVRRDPHVRFEGYWDNAEAEAERTRNGWYWTGDLAYRDDDGVFYFAGRTSDWLRVDGENFAAAPIERIIGRHPDVAAVAVFGVPDPQSGDQVMAVLELRPGRAFDPHGFAAFVAAQPDLGTKWFPRFVRVVDDLPVTGAGKLDKKPLRAQAWLGDGAVWWQPQRGAAYRSFTSDAAAVLAAGFEQHGRGALLPRS